MAYRIRVLACAVLTITAACQQSDPLQPVPLAVTSEEAADYVTGSDAIALNPPRAGWNPGLIFEGEVEGDTIKAEQILCTNIYGNQLPTEDDLIIATGGQTTEGNFSLAADLAEELIPGADIKVELAKLARSEDVTYGATRGAYRYYTLEDRLTFEPTPKCLRAISLLKERNTFNGRVFAIPSVYALQNVTYELSSTNEVGTEISASIAKVLEAAAKAGYKSAKTAKGTTIASNNGWITIKTGRPYLVDEWDVHGAVAGGGREVSVDLQAAPNSVKDVTLEPSLSFEE